MALGTLYIATAVVLISLYLLARKPKSPLPFPPGPPPWPIVGNLHQAPKSHPWLQYHAWSKKYGPVMHLNMAGQHVIILTGSKAAHDLLAKQGATFSDRPRFVVAHELALKGMHMLLRPYDDRFKLHQRLEAPVLSERAARAYLPIQELESKQLLFDLSNFADANRPMDCHEHMERMTASIIYSLFYSHRVRTARDPILLLAHAVNHEFDQLAQVGKYLVDSFPILDKLPSFLAPWKAEAASHWQRQRALHMGNLDRGLDSNSWNVAKQMQKALDTQGINIPAEELALDIGIMADAALDASSETMMWFVVACITEGHRGWVSKAQRDLDKVVGRIRLPNFEDRPALPYIGAIVEELLRWRPVGAAGVPHFTRVESSYEGFRIPANSVIIANHWSITREEAVFGPDVEAFVPERWLHAKSQLPTVGFGYGRRICPGRHVARNSLWIAVARLLWAFDIQPELTGAGELVLVDTKGTDGLVTKPLPFKARFCPRDDWVEEVVKGCNTRNVNHHEMLDRVGSDIFH